MEKLRRLTRGSDTPQEKGHFAWRAGRFARSQMKRTFGGMGADIKKYRIKPKKNAKRKMVDTTFGSTDWGFGGNDVVDFSSVGGYY